MIHVYCLDEPRPGCLKYFIVNNRRKGAKALKKLSKPVAGCAYIHILKQPEKGCRYGYFV